MSSSADWYRDDAALLTTLRSGRGVKPPAIPGYSELQELRRGGQGVVYVGRQVGTKRRVAIKVLLDSALGGESNRRRFEREIDLVAGLDHPNIVGIYHSGVTEDSRHFYVMEFIDGVGLDDLIDAPTTSIASALRFFQGICDAVTYAHQRGVIHRDLKPSNVRIDPQGQPHVLDFGLAKLTADAPDSAVTQMSQTGQFMGSLPWASPEQTAGVPSKIDVRTDVYSLGVLLFQLLTGQFPYPVTGELRVVLENIQRAEPRRPRTVNPAIDEELETLVLKCLAKEPERRYQSAGELAADVRSYLAGEPIAAKRDSAWYALRKNLHRYRTVARVTAAFAAVAIGASIWLGLLWQRATTAEKLAADRLQIAETARDAEERAHAATAAQVQNTRDVTQFLDTTLRFVDPWKHPGRDITPMREMLDKAVERLDGAFSDQPGVEAAIAGTLGFDYWTLNLYDQAEPLLRRAYELHRQTSGDEHRKTIEAMHHLASMLTERGRHAESEPLFRKLLEIEMRTLGPDHANTLKTMNNLALDIDWQGRVAEAAELYQRALDGFQRLGPPTIDTLHIMNNLSMALASLGKPEEGERLMREVVEGRTELLGAAHAETLQARMNLAQHIVGCGRVAEAERLLREVLAEIEATLGPKHTLRIGCTGNLADVLGTLGRHEEALALERQMYDAQLEVSGPDHPATLNRKNQVVCSLIELKRHAEAVALARELKEQLVRVVGAEDPRTFTAAGNLAYLLKATGAAAEAESIWNENIRLATAKMGENSGPVITAHTNLGLLCADTQRWTEAEAHYRAALGAMIELKQEAHWRAAVMRGGLGRTLLETGRLVEAQEHLLRAHAILYETFGDDHERTQRNLTFVVRLFDANGDQARAAEFRAKLKSELPAGSESVTSAPATERRVRAP